MMALSLFSLCVLAKAAILIGHDVPCSIWTPAAYLWQDALVALVLGAIEFAVRRNTWVSRSLYAAAVFYVAINVPLTRVTSSPMTWQMGRAARGALADSITHYLTLMNIALMGSLVLAGCLLPILMRRISPPVTCALALAGGALVILGPLATERVETIGLHRNALIAFIHSALPRMGARQAEGDWRESPLAKNETEDRGRDTMNGPTDRVALSSLRGTAAGRNVVIIHLESTGARYLRPFGAAEDPMPNLTDLAKQAVVFENAYAVYPESIKGLFSVVCSRYPGFDTQAESYEQVRTPSLAENLTRNGYRTGLFHSGRFAYLGMNAVIQHRGYQTLEDAGVIGGHFRSSFGVDEPATVQRMLAWIDTLPRGQAFLITYLPVAGHHPYDTPEAGPFPDTEEIGRYRNALHYGDKALGDFFAGLKNRGLETNTLFVIFGDHGEAFGQHEGNYGHTLFIHEENVHVPLLLAAPGLVREQIRVSSVASLIDVAPTILELLGLPVPAAYQGTSLLEGKEQMALFYTDYSLGFLGLRDGPRKFVYELESNRSTLFNVGDDAEETNDLAARFPERVRLYRHHLLRWSAAQRELLLGHHPPPGTG